MKEAEIDKITLEFKGGGVLEMGEDYIYLDSNKGQDEFIEGTRMLPYFKGIISRLLNEEKLPKALER